MLGQNNPITGFVHILPSAGLYLTQHFLECVYDTSVNSFYLAMSIVLLYCVVMLCGLLFVLF